MQLSAMQQALREEKLDGWLFFDHHQRDPLAYRVLQFQPPRMVTRRWFYYVPAHGEPVKLQHKIEPAILAALPGESRYYAGWQQLRDELSSLLKGAANIAMQYSPGCAVPYVANVDAGTIEFVRSLGVEVRTSANLVQMFEARWTEAQYDSHKEAQVRVDLVRRSAFVHVADTLRAGRRITEHDVADFIRHSFHEAGLFTDHGPIVAVNANASNPHYEPTAEQHSEIGKGDLLLIDLWAKLNHHPGAVYYDITWTGYCGETPPDEMRNVFQAVAGARDAAVARVQSAVASQELLAGYQVDDAAREYLKKAGLAEYFFHRTGHSIGEEVHGTGANMDNFETHDERLVIPNTCFSVEPGVYLPAFGIRSEVNVFRGETRAEVTGEIQTAILSLL